VLYVGSAAQLELRNGTINGNSNYNQYYSSYESNSYGGGVYINSGTFTMNGGKILGNSVSASSSNSPAKAFGGGVYMSSGTFPLPTTQLEC